MARPLREQLVLATLVLLIPVSAVMTWAGSRSYYDQLQQLQEEAAMLASAIGAHIEQTGPAADAGLPAYLEGLRVPDGTVVTVVRRDGSVVAKHVRADTGGVEEVSTSSRLIPSRGLSVHVAIPTRWAWWRASSVYSRTLAISGIATLILLGVEAVFIRRWLPALVHLERSADRVGGGDLAPLEHRPMPSRELEHLRDAFRDMVDRLRAAREAIAAQVEEERRMRQEMASLQQQIIRQERLAAIGVLIAGIAHELNNPLQAIAGFSEILQRDHGLRSDVRADLAVIQKESTRASGIIRNLSRFSRQHGARPGPVVMSEVVASVIELRQRRLGEQNIALELDERAAEPVHAVFAELQQVLLNFVINAEQSIVAAEAADRRITIRTFDRPGVVRVEVEDTGPGVPPEHESKLFQPFFTTKPVGEGTGLGLSVSYGIVRSFSGTIGYRRAVHGGAIFFVDLPAAPPVAAIRAS